MINQPSIFGKTLLHQSVLLFLIKYHFRFVNFLLRTFLSMFRGVMNIKDDAGSLENGLRFFPTFLCLVYIIESFPDL